MTTLTSPDRGLRPSGGRRVLRRWWPIPVAGLSLFALSFVATSDLMWMLRWTGSVLTISALWGGAVAMLGTDRPEDPLRPLRAVLLASSVALLIAMVFLRAATSSENGVPSFGTRLVILAPVMLASVVGLVAIIASRVSATLDRASSAVSSIAVAMLLGASLAFWFSSPLKARVDDQEQVLTEQAETLLQHPERFGQTEQGPVTWGTISDPGAETGLGDFTVSAIVLDDFDLSDCTATPGGGGLAFQLGSERSTSWLVYCPLREVEAGDIHSATDHLAGPWWVEFTDD